MNSLDRKVMRDLRQLWSQAVTIGLVVASGIAGFVACLSAVDTLAAARDDFYAQGRFADMFATAKRAPDGLAARLRELPGVVAVQTTVEAAARLTLEGSHDPAVGQLIGLDAKQPPELNRVTLRAGRRPLAGARAGGELEALVSEAFAAAHGLRPGSTVGALVNGRRRSLRITGIALSPEYIFAGLWGIPDMRAFGVFWVDKDELAAALDMRGAFNRVALKTGAGASQASVAAGTDRILAAYGGLPAHGRDEQVSHSMLDNEIREQRVLGTVLPAIFMAVAVFLLHVVAARLVATQREQVAALKALGYPDRRIAVHYVKLVAPMVAGGLVLGLALGKWLGVRLTALYAGFFHFPGFEHMVPAGVIASSFGIVAVTGLLGTMTATRATLRLSPAEAMRPPAPATYRRSLLESVPWLRTATALRMILRNMERRPLRAALTIAGTAAALAIVIMGNFFRDAVDVIVEANFTRAMRGDLAVWTADPVDAAAARELARLPGVLQVEPGRGVAVRFVNGQRSESGAIQGFAQPGELRRVIEVDLRHAQLPSGGGLMMTDRLAAKLGLRAGDLVTVEVREGRRLVRRVPLERTVRDMMGLNAFMERGALNRMLGEGDVASLFSLSVQRGAVQAVLDASLALPRVSGAFSKATMLRNMQEVTARNILIMSTLLTTFAAVIAVGVVYNNARIALSERRWELASLRVLGFTRAEVSMLLLGELALGIALALPLGMALGWALVHGVVELMRTDQFLLPVAIQPRTYAWAAVCVLAAGTASALVVRRQIDRLDMVAALKTRE